MPVCCIFIVFLSSILNFKILRILKKKSNIPKTFFGFLTASILFWLLINLSKQYTTEILFQVAYTNLPIKKIIIDTPVEKIPLLVKGSGFKLISTNFKNNILALNLSKVKNKDTNDYYFLTKELQPKLKNQLPSGIKLIRIQKDTIPLKIGTLHTKIVPLKPNLDLNFQLGYDLATPLKITPKNVLISGEKLIIEKIKELNLIEKKLVNVSENTKITSKIQIPEHVKTTLKSAEISIFVDKFTQGEIEIPVLVKNAPKGINIFPKKVNVIYKVGLKNFNKINPNLFKIACDYKQIKIDETSYLTPKLIKKPDSITIIRIVPKKIDFLIHKKTAK